MSWVEREYWQIVKRFAPDVSSLIGDESFALLEGGRKVECEAFGDLMGEAIRAALRSRRTRRPRRR